MSRSEQDTVVVIIGAGVAGLTLGNFLLRNGIDCVVLEKRSREHVEQRQRAGSLDGRGVRMFREWGLAEVIEAQAAHDDFDSEGMPLRVDGQERIWRALDVLDDEPGIFCPQQILVGNLIEVFLRDGGDLRFEVDVALHGLESPRPTVRYLDAAGTDEVINCDFVAGCDGYRGISRQSIPAGILTSYSYEHGYAWLAFLSAVRADPPAVMAVHSRGFAAQITRGPNLSRFYLQCPLTDGLEQWPDERIWSEVGARFGGPQGATGPITGKQIVPLRNVVHSPMQYRALYLLGDAAHLVSPMSARGMSLALYDAEVFARAVTHYVQQADSVPLENYSQTCLRYIWDTQVHAVWITNVMHDAGDPSYAGEFRKRLARAELERMMSPVDSPGD
ncbi:4-hydroxybenzoate 3-monooxygenase [Mycobacterium sp. 852013-50091_SCH5140682]|uniref:4-hydroxybenzoate 3-monooxygenase n=1 Tax=Mycobacterium sp. 852013-50091_SCH5140682 TaxID=1834109 RepID=UPI0007E9F87D|nr:4-hydroxybenzoate 3-monooxygenase [Mycobacterium sp. 852013-50091_SCH5140682]OBC01836.1 4-hydroxybenzoate 3-monooxygenase [Mycobacterium sp. 852013-50091_SCH5140682]